MLAPGGGAAGCGGGASLPALGSHGGSSAENVPVQACGGWARGEPGGGAERCEARPGVRGASGVAPQDLGGSRPWVRKPGSRDGAWASRGRGTEGTGPPLRPAWRRGREGARIPAGTARGAGPGPPGPAGWRRGPSGTNHRGPGGAEEPLPSVCFPAAAAGPRSRVSGGATAPPGGPAAASAAGRAGARAPHPGPGRVAGSGGRAPRALTLLWSPQVRSSRARSGGAPGRPHGPRRAMSAG